MRFAILLSLIVFFSVPNKNKKYTHKQTQRVELSTSESSVKIVGEIFGGWNSENVKLCAEVVKLNWINNCKRWWLKLNQFKNCFFGMFWVLLLGADSADFFANLTKVWGVTYLEGKMKVKLVCHGPLAE